MARAYDFAIVNAFTSASFGGNPALVVFLHAPLPDADTVCPKIAQNINQPIACFVSPIARATDTDAQQDTATFRIRWFAPEVEVPICGHGTLAAAHAILARPGLVAPRVRALRFETMHGTVSARRVPADGVENERIEIELPAFDVVPVDDAEFRRVSRAVAKALRKEHVAVKYVGVAGSGEGGSEVYLLVELDEKEDLGGADVDSAAFVGMAPYIINVLTAASTKPGITYETRMFAPSAGVPEDHVCGSANCLMAPYWASKLGVASNGEMRAKQVSKRGGDLWVKVDRERRKVLLQGEARLTCEGRIFI